MHENYALVLPVYTHCVACLFSWPDDTHLTVFCFFCKYTYDVVCRLSWPHDTLLCVLIFDSGIVRLVSGQ